MSHRCRKSNNDGPSMSFQIGARSVESARNCPDVTSATRDGEWRGQDKAGVRRRREPGEGGRRWKGCRGRREQVEGRPGSGEGGVRWLSGHIGRSAPDLSEIWTLMRDRVWWGPVNQSVDSGAQTTDRVGRPMGAAEIAARAICRPGRPGETGYLMSARRADVRRAGPGA